MTVLFAWGAPASATELFIPEVRGKVGQTIELPLMIDQIDNMAGIKVVVTYDADTLEYKSAVKSSQTTSLMHIVNDRKPGQLIIVMAGANGIQGKNFSIMTLSFHVKKLHKGEPEDLIAFAEIQMMSDQLKEIKSHTRVYPIRLSL